MNSDDLLNIVYLFLIYLRKVDLWVNGVNYKVIYGFMIDRNNFI